MISLSGWVNHHAKLPLMRLVGMALGVQLMYFGYLTYNRCQNQLESNEQMGEAISLGVQRANRPLIELPLTSVLVNSDSVFEALCVRPAVSIPYLLSDTGRCRYRAQSLIMV